LDPDLGWHLKIGQDIIFTQAVPSVNLYNFSYMGDWVDHEWLANAIMFKVYHQFGYQALVVLFSLLILVVFIGLNLLVNKKISSQPLKLILIASLQFFGLLAILRYCGVRIQELTPFFLLIELFVISYYEKTRRYCYLFFLLPLFYLWANLHASFLIGLFLLGAWLCIKIFERFLNINSLTNKQLLVFFGFSLAAFILTLLTPYKLELYSFLADYRNTAYMSLLEEWRSQFDWPLNYLELAYILTVISTVAIYIYRSIVKKDFKINIWPLFLAIMFVFLSLKSRRHLPLLFVVSFEMVILVAYSFFRLKIGSALRLFKNVLIINLLKVSVIIYLGLLICLQIYNIKSFNDPFQFFSLSYPYNAVHFLKNNGQYAEGNIFNSYEWGGYLIWNYQTKKIFIDGRFPQIQVNGQTFLEEYLDFFSTEAVIAKKLKEYNISLVMIANKQENANLIKHLSSDNSWYLVYGDPVSLCYYRDAVNLSN
jgi:hypothetical protein